MPADLAGLDPRKFIKASFNTADQVEAERQRDALDRALEAEWDALRAADLADDDWARQSAAARVARSSGVDYRPADEILAGNSDELVSRLLMLNGREEQTHLVEALLGMAPMPQAMLSGLFPLYMTHKGAELDGYSPSQLRKHMQSKERAAKYLLDVLGERALADVTRADVLKFRDWWVAKVAAEGLSRDAANRSFSDIQGMLHHIDRALKTTYSEVWGGLRIAAARRSKTKRRPPFSTGFIQERILAPGALDTIPFQARMLFYAMIETGIRPSEGCNLLPDAIHPWDDIPWILVTETDDRILKSENATRIMPLVGVSLWAFRQCPGGFPEFRDNEDSFSALINRHLRRLGLKETPAHTAYSMRHAFYDRIHAQNPGDRLETELMGHEFGRAKYGEGSPLRQKFELLDRIKFNWAMDQVPAA